MGQLKQQPHVDPKRTKRGWRHSHTRAALVALGAVLGPFWGESWGVLGRLGLSWCLNPGRSAAAIASAKKAPSLRTRRQGPMIRRRPRGGPISMRGAGQRDARICQEEPGLSSFHPSSVSSSVVPARSRETPDGPDEVRWHACGPRMPVLLGGWHVHVCHYKTLQPNPTNNQRTVVDIEPCLHPSCAPVPAFDWPRSQHAIGQRSEIAQETAKGSLLHMLQHLGGAPTPSSSHLVSSLLLLCLGSETEVSPTGWRRKPACRGILLRRQLAARQGSWQTGTARIGWSLGPIFCQQTSLCSSLTRAAGMETCFRGPCGG